MNNPNHIAKIVIHDIEHLTVAEMDRLILWLDELSAEMSCYKDTQVPNYYAKQYIAKLMK